MNPRMDEFQSQIWRRYCCLKGFSCQTESVPLKSILLNWRHHMDVANDGWKPSSWRLGKCTLYTECFCIWYFLLESWRHQKTCQFNFDFPGTMPNKIVWTHACLNNLFAGWSIERICFHHIIPSWFLKNVVGISNQTRLKYAHWRKDWGRLIIERTYPECAYIVVYSRPFSLHFYFFKPLISLNM